MSLAATGDRVETALDGMGDIMDGIVFTDREGRIRMLNAVAEDLLGVKSMLAIGKTIQELDGREELMKALATDSDIVASLREMSQTVEIHHGQQDLIYIKAQTTQVKDCSGQQSGTLTILRDVTAEYKTDQLKNQYLSIVAHELRTPLTGIKTFSTMMAKGALGSLNDKQHRVIESIREQSLRLEHQIDKLINLGQIDSNQYGQDLEVFELYEFLHTSAAPFGQAATDRGIRLTVQPPDRNSQVKADRAALKRAVQALIENAVKFTPDGGEVSVASTVSSGEVRFVVKDSGIGIDPRYHRRILEKFFQVEDPLTRQHGGAGLGLFVAAGIVEAHGSSISIESELGGGAEFSFVLPIHQGTPVRGQTGGRQEPVAT